MMIQRYDASGNTFVIFHTEEEKDYSELAKKLCKQENTDGLIAIVPHEEYDFKWLFYNNDGSTASMCGNGTRAVAHYAYTNNLCGSDLDFLTDAGKISCTVDDDIVETTMTKPIVHNENFDQEGFEWFLADTGVPHLVTLVDDLEKFNLDVCAKMREAYNANVNFANVKDGKLYVRTFERGVENETLACGTGMVASFIRANTLGLIEESCDVYPKSNELISIKKENETIYFKGKVTKDYTKEL